MGHGSGYDSAHSSATIEDDSPVKEVAPVKAKKVSKRASKAKMTDDKDTSKPWTTAEEITLCKAEHDAITSKWKNRVRPRIGAFHAIIDNVERMNESGSCNLIVFQKALAEYEAQYDHAFTLEACLNILKDHAP
nr:hypothetical protein [Tanacetum cinerariifolium]